MHAPRRLYVLSSCSRIALVVRIHLELLASCISITLWLVGSVADVGVGTCFYTSPVLSAHCDYNQYQDIVIL